MDLNNVVSRGAVTETGIIIETDHSTTSLTAWLRLPAALKGAATTRDSRSTHCGTGPTPRAVENALQKVMQLHCTIW